MVSFTPNMSLIGTLSLQVILVLLNISPKPVRSESLLYNLQVLFLHLGSVGLSLFSPVLFSTLKSLTIEDCCQIISNRSRTQIILGCLGIYCRYCRTLCSFLCYFVQYWSIFHQIYLCFFISYSFLFAFGHC